MEDGFTNDLGGGAGGQDDFSLDVVVCIRSISACRRHIHELGLNEHVPKIIQMRRSIGENQSKSPAELTDFFTAEEQRSNPWGIAPAAGQ